MLPWSSPGEHAGLRLGLLAILGGESLQSLFNVQERGLVGAQHGFDRSCGMQVLPGRNASIPEGLKEANRMTSAVETDRETSRDGCRE